MRFTDVAWAAGLFEGEGTIYLTLRRGRTVPALVLALGMTDEDVVRRFAAVIGAPVYGPYGPYHLGTKPIWRAVLTGRKAASTIKLFEPWLGHRRRAQADALLSRKAAS